MKRIIYGLLIMTIMIACSSNSQVDYSYEFIDKRMDDSYSVMELYTIKADPDIDTLMMFCSEKIKSFSSGRSLYVVFFDSKENAVFPNNPFVAFYGIDEGPQRHIKAYLEYNKVNDFSELKVYDSNSWEGKAKVIKL